MAILRLQKIRFTIGQGMMAVAVCAVACTWPERFATAAIMGLSGFLTLHLLLSKSKVIQWIIEYCIVLAIVAAIVAICQPAIAIR
jgi:hypothetical protein